MTIDLVARWTTAFGREVPWAVAAMLGAAAWAFALRHRSGRAGTRGVAAGLALVVLAGLAWAWHLRWIADDAFISFRYAANLAGGHGLVWNPGERVEGYTNFAWTLLAAGAIRCGASPIEASLVLSLASFALVIVGTHRLVVAWSSPEAGAVPSLAAVTMAASYSMASFGTSGMETMFAAALALWAVERAEAGRVGVAGALGVLALLAHPDHGIFYVALGVMLALGANGSRVRVMLRYTGPLLVVWLPYFAWRWWYYGDLAPNTYYAKLGDAAYFGQGGVFLLVCAVAMGLLPAALFAPPGAAAAWDKVGVRAVALGVPVYCVYVAKIGGDFMLARLLVPVMPFLLALAEVAVRARLRAVTTGIGMRRAVFAGVGVVALALPAVPIRLLAPRERAFLVADERTFYPLVSLRPLDIDSPHFRFAKVVETFVAPRGVRPRVAVGSVGISGYLTGLPMIDTYGLTDRTIARQPVRHRGLPGHEKRASPAYLHARAVDLSEGPIFPPPWSALTRFRLGEVELWAGRFDAKSFDALAGLLTEWADVRRRLDAYDPRGRSEERVGCDMWFFDRYYFAAVQDPARRDALESKVVAAHPSLAPTVRFSFSSREVPGARQVVISLDRAALPWTATGRAFAPGPRDRPVAGEPLAPDLGRPYLSTFTDGAGRAAVGRLRSPPFVLTSDVLVIPVAGGRGHRGVGVQLVAEGRVERTAAACDSPIARRAAWDVADLRGRTAVVEVLDASDSHYVAVGQVEGWRAAR